MDKTTLAGMYQMKLYYVALDAARAGVDSSDTYVWANDPEQAATLAKQYWGQFSGWKQSLQYYVDEVPTDVPAQPAVVPWEDVARIEKLVDGTHRRRRAFVPPPKKE
jgi:hypothetical protein